MSAIHYRLTIALLAAGMLAGQACTVLAPQEDHSRFFVLTTTADAAAPAATAPALGRDLSVGVGPVTLPGYLKRPEMVTRVGADQLEFSNEDRWAEALDSNFQHVLGQDLSQMLGTQRISLFPWYGNPQIDYRVEVQVHRFDLESGGQSQLSASWIVKDGRTGAVLFATETLASSAVSVGDDGGAAALSEDVSTLSRQIAERIVKLSEDRTRG